MHQENINLLPDMETQFIIAGPIKSEEQTWWNTEHGWTPDIKNATTLPKAILTSPLPPGGVGIMEITDKWEYVHFYERTSFPHQKFPNNKTSSREFWNGQDLVKITLDISIWWNIDTRIGIAHWDEVFNN